MLERLDNRRRCVVRVLVERLAPYNAIHAAARRLLFDL